MAGRIFSSRWLLALLFLIPLFFNPAPTLSQKQSDKVTIRMVKGGFEPKQVIIKNGQTVRFQNEDSIDRWPASNIHPTHGIYPEFDPRQAIAPGKSWQFTFSKNGRWRFHDHLNSQLTGLVIVEGSQISQIEEKKGLLTKFPTYQAHLLKFYYHLFPNQLYKELDSLNSIEVSKDQDKLKYWLIILGGKQFMDKLVLDSDGGSKVDCHQEAHLIGRAAFEIEKQKVFQNITYSCHSGFLHGALEAFIKNLGNQDIVKAVEDLCNKFPTSFTKFECLHGIGHGFTAFVDYDLPEALKLCKSLPDDYSRRSCYGGIFMENIMVAEGKGATPGHQSRWISSDPHFPCNKVEQDPLVQYECYQMQTSRMLHLSNYNFSQVTSWCLSAPADMIPVCFRSMGRDVAGQTLRDSDKIINLCRASPPELFRDCLTGAINVVIDFWGEDLADQPHQICKKLPKVEKSFCYQLLGTRLKDIFNQKPQIEKICQMSESEFVGSCLGNEKTAQANIPKGEIPLYLNWQSTILLQALNWLSNQPPPQTIKITSEGFEPDELVISQSSKVMFLNTDSKSHWPASDFHPTHDLFPEFDPKQAIESGQSWEFEFKKGGTFKYHDHLDPHRKGQILVESKGAFAWITSKLNQGLPFLENFLPKKSAAATLKNSPNMPSQEEFLRLTSFSQLEKLSDLTAQEGVQKTWDFIVDTFKNRPQDIAQAHDLAHLEGGLIYDLNGLNGLSICTADFAFGCFHGLLDKAFSEDTSSLNQAEQACLKLGGVNSGPFSSCIHGIGHGLASFHKSKELMLALNECNRLKNGQTFCYDGVMMEFARSASPSFYNQEDPLYPCNQLDEVYSVPCGRNQPGVMLSRFKFDFLKIAGICASSQNLAFKNACFDSLGFYSVTASGGQVEKITQMCQSFQDLDFLDHCLKSAAGELVFQNINNWQTSSQALCTLLSNWQTIESCHQYVQGLARDYGR